MRDRLINSLKQGQNFFHLVITTDEQIYDRAKKKRFRLINVFVIIRVKRMEIAECRTETSRPKHGPSRLKQSFVPLRSISWNLAVSFDSRIPILPLIKHTRFTK